MASANIEPDARTKILSIHNKKDVNGGSAGAKGLNDDEYQNFVYREAAEAKLYAEEHLMIAREKATDYYHGRLPDVDLMDSQEEDRSRAVVTAVRDTVLGFMPDIMRLFTTGNGMVEYQAPVLEDADPQRLAQSQQQAKIATAYVRNVVLKVDNPDFFMHLHDSIKDAAVRKSGFLRWRWKVDKRPEYSHYTDVPEDLAQMLVADEDVEVVSKMPHMVGDAAMGQSIVYDLEIRRTRDFGFVRIEGAPCENVIISAGARNIDEATVFGYTDEKMAGDFIAEGFIDDLSELDGCDHDPQDRDNVESLARRPGQVAILSAATPDPPEDPSRRKVKFAELYVRCDKDGDGIAELRRVITAGTRFKILSDEPWDEIDWAGFCCYPEAFEFYGESLADLTMDTQRISSRIVRDTLDSLAQSIKPQTVVVEGQVNLDDVLNPDVSNVVRERAPNMVRTLEVPFVGKEALPVLAMIDQYRQNRTGISDATAGLDPKTFQSTDAGAIQNTLTKGEGRVEFVARMLVETGFKRLFRGVLRLLCKHQDAPRMVELFGKPTSVDPRFWNERMHVEPTVPLGRGGQMQQLQALAGIKATQEQLLMQLGPTNPFVTIDQYHTTLAKMCDVAGWHNTSDFFTDPATFTPEQRQQIMQAMMQAMQQAAQGKGGQGQGPDPQVEMAKIQSHEKIKGAEIQAKAQTHAAQLQEKAQASASQLRLKQAEMQYDAQLKMIETMVQANTQIDVAKINAMIDHAGARLDAAVKLEIERMKPKEPTGDK